MRKSRSKRGTIPDVVGADAGTPSPGGPMSLTGPASVTGPTSVTGPASVTRADRLGSGDGSERARHRTIRPKSTIVTIILATAVVPVLLSSTGLLIWLSYWEDISTRGLFIAFGLSTLAVAGATYASRRLAHWLVRRLERIDDGLSRVQRGDYTTKLDIDVADELGVLACRIAELGSAAASRERRIVENALSDPLTGLHNRALLTDRIQAAIANAQRTRAKFTLTVIDMDRFKFVNDTLGHSVGDRLLKEVARRLKETVRESDTIARLGGDEFVLLISGNAESAREVAERVLEVMRVPLKTQGQSIDIGLSMGIAVYPEHGQDEATLLRHADVAMNRAKREQKGFIVFDGEGGEVRRSYLSMLSEMRTALEKGQMLLEYQPKMDLHSGLIVGVEGLVRWNHPVRGRIPPGEFIPFAEQSGFMRELTRWVIREGANFSIEMAKLKHKLRVSVNITAADVQAPDFCSYVEQVIKEFGIAPGNLCLEVTESGMVSESDAALRNMQQLSEMGIMLSVDDFGTGYATLKQLQQLPVHELKIDRSFVSGMHQNRGNQSIVRATIELAKQLGLSVVAEGVESIKELRALAAMGCDEVQGFYVSRPMAASALPEWIDMRHSLYSSSREKYFEMLLAESR